MSGAPTSPAREAWRRLRRSPSAIVGSLTLFTVTLACFALPGLLSLDPASTFPELQNRPPSAAHWFGTDGLGRDLFARVLIGGRTSLLVGLAATLASVAIGVAYGALAGYYGGRVDEAMMRVVDGLPPRYEVS